MAAVDSVGMLSGVSCDASTLTALPASNPIELSCDMHGQTCRFQLLPEHEGRRNERKDVVDPKRAE
jgi:hypothetical protein